MAGSQHCRVRDAFASIGFVRIAEHPLILHDDHFQHKQAIAVAEASALLSDQTIARQRHTRRR